MKHRQIKNPEAAACNQHSSNKETVYRLFSLEFHHTSGNDVFPGIFASGGPAVDNCVKHDHVKTCKSRSVQKVEKRGGISVKHIHVYSWAFVSCNCACQNQDNTHRAAPASKLFYRLVLMLFLDHVQNIGAFHIKKSKNACADHNQGCEACRYPETPEIHVQNHFF